MTSQTVLQITNAADFNAGYLLGGISADGRYVLFYSEASDLVAGDTNFRGDLFLYDAVLKKLSNITHGNPFTSEGGFDLRYDYQLGISADGDTIAFMNQDPIKPDPVYTYNRLTAQFTSYTTEYDPVNSKTAPIAGGSFLSITGDGQHIAFDSPIDYGFDALAYTTDAFLYSIASDKVSAFSTNANGQLTGGYHPLISDDGSAYVYRANDGTGWYRIGVTGGLRELAVPDSSADQTDLSGNGKVLVYRSSLDSLVANDNNNLADIFVYDHDSGKTTRVSVNSAGQESNGASSEPQVSADGNLVAFISNATNLDKVNSNLGPDRIYLHDRRTGTTTLVSEQLNFTSGLEFSADGRYLVVSASTAGIYRAPQVYRIDIGAAQRFTPGNDKATLEDTGEKVDALAGNDTVEGGAGNDTVRGSAGADVLRGRGGKDVLLGGPGNDLINGGPAADRLEGGGGNDSIIGKTGDDRLTGGDGKDRLDGGDGKDSVFGQAGDDILTGGRQADKLFGGDGKDRLYGGLGNDNLDGGPQNDVLLGSGGRDFVDGGDGIDTLDLSMATGKLNIDVTFGSTTPTAGQANNFSTTRDRIDFQNVEKFILGKNHDTFTATKRILTVSGKDGHDDFETAGGSYYGNAGLDKFLVTDAKAITRVFGGSGRDQVITVSGQQDRYDGGAGDDLLSYERLKQAVDVNLATGRAFNGLHTLSGFEWVTGTAFADTLTGDKGSNLLRGGKGDDTLNGKGGKDKLYGGLGKDKLRGGKLDDTLVGGSNKDTLIGGTGKDNLRGGAGADQFGFLSADEGGDIIKDFNRSEHDTLVFRKGNFAGLSSGPLAGTHFEKNTTGMASESDIRFIFNTKDAKLYFDADGSGSRLSVTIATLEGTKDLASTDLRIASIS